MAGSGAGRPSALRAQRRRSCAAAAAAAAAARQNSPLTLLAALHGAAAIQQPRRAPCHPLPPLLLPPRMLQAAPASRCWPQGRARVGAPSPTRRPAPPAPRSRRSTARPTPAWPRRRPPPRATRPHRPVPRRTGGARRWRRWRSSASPAWRAPSACCRASMLSATRRSMRRCELAGPQQGHALLGRMLDPPEIQGARTPQPPERAALPDISSTAFPPARAAPQVWARADAGADLTY
jgi:hypothetical protein